MKLTPRQRDVVALLAAGNSCPEVARKLGISVKTVYHHVEDVGALVPGKGDVPALRWVKRHAEDLLAA